MWLNKVASSLSRIVYPLTRAVNVIGIVSMLAMMLLTATDITLRYLFSLPIVGAPELTEFLMLILVSFGLSYTAVKREHVIIDFVTQYLSKRVKAVVNVTTHILGIGIFMAWLPGKA